MNWLLLLECALAPTWVVGAVYHYAGYLPGGRFHHEQPVQRFTE